MEIRTMKGVRRDKWLKFKEIAAKKGIRMGDLFENMIDVYSEKSDEFWDEILSGKKRLSNKEAKEMHKIVKELRKDRGFRI